MTENNEHVSTLRDMLSGILGSIPYGIMCVSDALEVQVLNQKACEILGLSHLMIGEFIDRHFENVFVNEHSVYSRISEVMLKNSKPTLDLTEISIGKRVVTIKCRTMPKGFLVVLRDITQESLLLHRATHDSLTEVHNRQYLEETLDTRIPEIIEAQKRAAFAYVDIDNFKSKNDKYGHAVGDEILKCVASLLKGCVKDKDIIARLSGDEFAIFFNDCALAQAEKILLEVIKKIESIEIFTQDALVRTTVSIGLTSVEKYETDTFTSLMSVADTACHLAKSEGRNTLHVIEATGCEFKDHLTNVKWIDEIEQAISHKRLLLYGQNIEDLREESQPYCEVLVRLKQQNGNIVSPSAFIPQAERFKVMPLVDRHVFESLVRSMVDNITYSVNLSGQTISDESFVAFVERIMDTYVFEPKNIIFEITETMAMMSMDDTVSNIMALREKGFSFSLDDFGTGLASFNYLKSLPVDTVKIDGLFIRDISSNRTSGQIVKSICDVAHSMGLKTVAEYVTDETIYNEVKNLDVDYAQGYFIHEPELLGAVHGSFDPDIAQAT